jgi:hypothetical protein
MTTKIQAGDIVLTNNRQLRGNQWVARAIAFFEEADDRGDKAVYTHAGIAIDSHEIVESLARVEVSDVSKYDEVNRCVIGIRNLDVAQRAAIAAEARKRIGAPYAWGKIPLLAADSLASWFTGRRVRWAVNTFGLTSKLVCSQLVVSVIKTITGKTYFQENAKAWNPDDLEDHALAHPEWFDVTYYGRMK